MGTRCAVLKTPMRLGEISSQLYYYYYTVLALWFCTCLVALSPTAIDPEGHALAGLFCCIALASCNGVCTPTLVIPKISAFFWAAWRGKHMEHKKHR